MKKLYASLACLTMLVGAHAQTFTKLSGTAATSTGPHPGITEISTPTYREFQLTTNSPIEQKAAVWNDNLYSLTSNWTISAELNFGPWSETNPDGSKALPVYRTGADGIAFVISRDQYLGQWGEEVGYGTLDVLTGIYTPKQSLAFEMDTWKNETTGFNGSEGYRDHNERDGNHKAFMAKGNSFHTPGVFPALQALQTMTADLERLMPDGGWIQFTASWNAAMRTLTITSSNFTELNSSITLTEAQMIDIFGSTTGNVYLGFSAATGSAANNHRIRWMTPPPPPADCGQLRTQTQGGWGTRCSGNNPGCYRDANFAMAFPAGVRLGSTAPGGRSVVFTTSAQVEEFLPSGGPNRTLQQLGIGVGSTNYTSAIGSQIRSNINGQLLALSLSVGFDEKDPNFGAAGVKLADMIIGSGPHAGMTVGAFLAMANNVIGGTASGNLNDIQSTADAINNNYVDGTVDNGYLTCPPGTASARIGRTGEPVTVIGSEVERVQPVQSENLGINVYPNPSRGILNVNTAQLPAGSEIQVISSRGNIVARRAAGGAQTVSFDVRQFGTGVYMIKVINGGKVQTGKVLVQE